MARSAWLRITSAGLFAGSLGFLVLSGCFTNVGAQPGDCVDDENPCTIDTCDTNGTAIHTPAPNADKIQCFLGENEGVCTDGACELICKTQMTPCKCNSKADCPADNFCATWACTMGQCVSTAMMEGMTADPLMPGDCQKKICQGGALKVVDDPTDTKTDVKGDCQDPVCNMGVPGTMPNDNDVPAMDDKPGDCNKPACNGGVLGTEPDTTDIPKPTECIVYGCNANGMPTPANAAVGTKCGPNMALVCDKVGMCVGCLESGKDNYDKCQMTNGGSCPVPKCEGQPCMNKDECSKECTDGVCCDTTCTEECKSCNLPGSEGKCTNVPYYQTDTSYFDPTFMTNVPCDNTSRCDGAGMCLQIIGKGCGSNADCISGKCGPASVCLGAKGEPCMNGVQCASGTCNGMGFCT